MNIIRNNVHLNAIVIMLFYLFCSGLFPFSVATEPQLSFVKRPMDTGYALGSSTQMASKNTFNKNNPIVIEANKAVAEALAYQTINDKGNNNNHQGNKKPFDKSKYCHSPTKECFVKNLATLPYGKLKGKDTLPMSYEIKYSIFNQAHSYSMGRQNKIFENIAIPLLKEE